jgi:hypothetical protein
MSHWLELYEKIMWMYKQIQCNLNCVMWTQCYQCHWIVHSWFPLQFSLSFIQVWNCREISQFNLEVPVRLWHLYILIPVRLRHLYILMLVLIFFYKNLQSFIVDVKFRIWNPIPNQRKWLNRELMFDCTHVFQK